MKLIHHFDVTGTKIIGNISPRAHGFFDVLGYLTMPYWWAAVMIMMILFDIPKNASAGSLVLILVAVPFAAILKLFIKRKRPPTIYARAMKVKSYSFPSSHAYSSSLVGGYCAYLSLVNNVPALSIVLVILSITIGISRVHLGAHYPSDVIGGWALASSILYIVVGQLS